MEWNGEGREAKDEMDLRDIFKEEWISLRSVREGQIRFIWFGMDKWVNVAIISSVGNIVEEADLVREESTWITMGHVECAVSKRLKYKWGSNL